MNVKKETGAEPPKYPGTKSTVDNLGDEGGGTGNLQGSSRRAGETPQKKDDVIRISELKKQLSHS